MGQIYPQCSFYVFLVEKNIYSDKMEYNCWQGNDPPKNKSDTDCWKFLFCGSPNPKFISFCCGGGCDLTTPNTNQPLILYQIFCCKAHKATLEELKMGLDVKSFLMDFVAGGVSAAGKFLI